MPLRFRIAFSILLVTLLRPQLLLGAPSMAMKFSPDSEHFVILYNKEETRELYVRDFLKRHDRIGGTVTANEMNQLRVRFRRDIRELFAALEKSYQVYVDQMGMEPPSGVFTTVGEKKYLNVYYKDFGADHASVGGVVKSSSGNGELCLNTRKFLILARHPGGRERFAVTAAHELFHAVQLSYDKAEDSWLTESTAVWASMEVFPSIHSHHKNQVRVMRYGNWPFHYDDRYANKLYKMKQGRPYGTVLFFNFLQRQNPSQSRPIMKRIWQQAKSHAGENGLLAVSQGLGDSQLLGEQFREKFDRYAIGCLLNDEAPPSYQLADLETFRSPKPGGGVLRLRSPAVNLTDWYVTRLASVNDVDSVAIPVHFGSGGLNVKWGRIAGCGFRHFRLKKNVPAVTDAALRVSVVADEKEVSLQGMVKRGGVWKILRGSFDSASGRHLVRIPEFAKTESNYVYFVVTRYSPAKSFKTFRLRLHAVDPPVVRQVRVRQNSRTVADLKWVDQRDSENKRSGRKLERAGDGRLDSAADLRMEITFSQPLAQSQTPNCRLGSTNVALSPVDNKRRTWRGELTKDKITGKALTINLKAKVRHAGSSVALPLDENPETVADVGPDGVDWVRYERTGKGQAILLGGPVDSPVKITQHVHRADGSTVGEVVNDGKTPYHVTVRRIGLNAAGQPTVPSSAPLSHHGPLMPGQREGFLVRHSGGPQAVRYELSTEVKAAAVKSPADGLMFSDVTITRKHRWGFRSKQIDTTYEVTAVAENTSGVKGFGGFRIGLTLYDDQGKVIDFIYARQVGVINLGATAKLKLETPFARHDVAACRLSCAILPDVRGVFEANFGAAGAEVRGLKEIKEQTKNGREYPYLVGTLHNTGQAKLHRPGLNVYFVDPSGQSASGGGARLKQELLEPGASGPFKISLSQRRNDRKLAGPEISYVIKP